MCGIVGVVGKQPCLDKLMEGLRRLEYRGYDSAGVGLVGPDGIQVHRALGRVANLASTVPEHQEVVGLAHTRWATHGGVEERNAHPHTDQSRQLAVVHNGIIDNADQIRRELERVGVVFQSETDTEVIAQLIGHLYQGDPTAALDGALARLHGTWGLVVAFAAHPDRLFVARHGSPLVVGLGEGEIYVASDSLAIASWADRVVYLDDGDRMELTSRSLASLEGRSVALDPLEDVHLGAHDCFMEKEIHEQAAVLRRTLSGRVTPEGTLLSCLTDHPELRRVRRITLLACGTSFHASNTACRTVEQIAGIPARAVLASEFVTDGPLLESDALYIGVSQSGETFDTLAAIRRVKAAGLPTLGVVNVVGSSLAREADAGLFLHAGREIAVASTKAFTAQLVALTTLALGLAPAPFGPAHAGLREALLALPAKVERAVQVLEQSTVIDELAAWIDEAGYAMFIGRGASQHVAAEAALKTKELGYVPCDAYAGGEMKHGPIAMLTDGTPVVAVLPRDAHREAMLASISEVRARGARVVVVCEEGDLEIEAKVDRVIPVPSTHPLLTPVLSVLPLQMLAMRLAVLRGLDVDKPRNLAKSVTVG